MMRHPGFFILFAAWLTIHAPASAVAAETGSMHGNFENNVDRPLRYFPVDGDLVTTNGPEFFNRPLYCANSAFRVDGGDKPEFSIYAPGRGGNLRLGIKTGRGTKWLNDAKTVIARYHAGSLLYSISDPLLGNTDLDLAVLPLSGTKGFIIRVTVHNSATPVTLISAFGGANGMRGKRAGDIGCEKEPVSEFFQLRPEECAGNEFALAANTFRLKAKPGTFEGVFPTDSKLGIADARRWDSINDLLNSEVMSSQLSVVVAKTELVPQQPAFIILRQIDGALSEAISEPASVFAAAEKHRAQIANQVAVETPDPFINAAVPALNVAADAIWDSQQNAFMHGAVAWRVRLLGWRGPYAGDALGWHERTAFHFIGFAKEQNTAPIPETIPPADEGSNLARSEAALHSNGDLTKSHYDMNLVAVDAFFRHLLWTGDLQFARTNWPVIERHLAWERRLFRREYGDDHLPLYEAYAAIWASDNLSYNGGGATHSTAYNYFENLMAARVAKWIGKDSTPYQREAELIRRGMEKYLWLQNEGTFAEYRDYLGLQAAHSNIGLWTFYHTVDSAAASPSEAWQMSRWIDNHIPRIPIHGKNVPNETLFTVPETTWMPYQWSLNNVVMAEAAHTALAYWQVNRPETAFALFKGELLDSMFMGLCPGNVGCMTPHDVARGEAQRDFADAIGINSRALVEGLFGIRPDALAGELKIIPGFPAEWAFAKIHHPDVEFQFHRNKSNSDSYSIRSRFRQSMALNLQIIAGGTEAQVTVNGHTAAWKWNENPGPRRIEIDAPAGNRFDVTIKWSGPIPAAIVPSDIQPMAPVTSAPYDWEKKVPDGATFKPVTLLPYFNDHVTQIFKNEYRSPRSPFCSLALPKQGIGGWADCNTSFEVDDSGIRELAAGNSDEIILPNGVRFQIPTNSEEKNILFTSQWRNYPDKISIPLSGRSSHAFLLMAGSTGPMQSHFDNGEVVVTYQDGSSDRLVLRNPTNWWPIDQDYFIDDFSFRRTGAIPPRIDLKTGTIRILKPETFKGRGGVVPGGAATVLELPLNKNKELKDITVHTLANEVVIGLMALTLER